MLNINDLTKRSKKSSVTFKVTKLIIFETNISFQKFLKMFNFLFESFVNDIKLKYIITNQTNNSFDNSYFSFVPSKHLFGRKISSATHL
jgi:hypothetical protein